MEPVSPATPSANVIFPHKYTTEIMILFRRIIRIDQFYYYYYFFNK